MRRWYVTLRIQMAVDTDGTIPKEEVEQRLGQANVEFPYDRQLTPYNPDQVDVEYLEPADA